MTPVSALSSDMEKWSKRLCRRYKFSSHHLKVLRCTAESWDVKTEARETWKAQGMIVTNRFGEQRPHPAIAIERDARRAFLQGVRELCLADEDLPADENRPPRPAGRYVGRP